MQNALFIIIYIHLIITYRLRCFIRIPAANKEKTDSKSAVDTVMRVFTVQIVIFPSLLLNNLDGIVFFHDEKQRIYDDEIQCWNEN